MFTRLIKNKNNIINVMANLTELNTIIVELFDVISTIIGEVVELITGDLLVLTIVGAFIGFIVALIYMILKYVQNATNLSSMKIKK